MARLLETAAGDSIPVVSYARASSDRRMQDEHSVKDQHKVNRRTAERRGWTVVGEFTDNDRSAANPDVVREEFELMIKALRAGKLTDGTPIRGVVHSDRLVRRPGDYERFVDAFTYNDDFVFSDEKITLNLYSEDVESMGLIGAVISKMEVRKMQRRMRNWHRARAEEGSPPIGPRAFGWAADRVTEDPIEGPLLRNAIKEIIGGRSLNSIMTEWNRKGITTTVGGAWRTTTLSNSLRNPRLCGWRKMKSDLVRDREGNPVTGTWDAIVTPEEWLAVQEIIESRRGHFINRDGSIGESHQHDFREHKYLMTGILRCGRIKENGQMCRALLGANKRKGEGAFNYRCPPKNRGGCGGVARRGDKVDEFLSEAVLGALEDAAMAAKPETSLVWPRLAEMEEAQSRYDEHIRQYQVKGISTTLFYRLLPDLENELNALRVEKNKFEASVTRRQVRAGTDVAEIRRRWYLPEEEGGLPLSSKRVYVREAFVAVIIHPSGKTGRASFNPDLLEPIWREG